MSEPSNRPRDVATPRQPSGALIHSRLLGQLLQLPGGSVAAITGPPGYGKTTLLSQLSDRSPRSAYVRCSAVDDDPVVLLQKIADAIDEISPIPEDMSRSLITPATAPGLQAAARLAAAIGGPGEPAILMIDDAHVVADQRSVDALTLFADRLPGWLSLAIAGRQVTGLPLARWRSEGRLAEFGIEDLALDAAAVRDLAAGRGLKLSLEEAARLVARTEGWPVALYLALLALADADARGRDRAGIEATDHIGDYIESELVMPLDEESRSWLRRSSVLDVMNGPLCDAALEWSGSLARLRELERSNMLVSAVDRGRTAFRYHPLFRQHLRDQLEAHDPHSAREISARAARWHADQGDAMTAVEYAHASADESLSAELITRGIWPIMWSGRIATIERWIAPFDVDGSRRRNAALAVVTGFMFALEGRRHEAETWLAAAEHSDDHRPMPDGTPGPTPWVAVLRGLMMPEGLERMRDDVGLAAEGLRPDSPLVPGARMLAAVESVLRGDHEVALDRAREAWQVSESRGAIPGFSVAIAEEVALAMRDGAGKDARQLLGHGLDRVGSAGMEDYVSSAMLHALAARAAMARGAAVEARLHIGRVNRIRPRLTASVPWFAAQVRLETIRACLALADVASARTLLREVEDVLRVRPDLGVLTTEATELRETIDAAAEAGAGLWTLTTAELRVLSFLPTHLTFREIAERLHVSQHTVKTQAVAIYSKLAASSRGEAIETAVQHGLLDPSALRFPDSARPTSGNG